MGRLARRLRVWLEHWRRDCCCYRGGHLRARFLYTFSLNWYESETDCYKRYRCDYCKEFWSIPITNIEARECTNSK